MSILSLSLENKTTFPSQRIREIEFFFLYKICVIGFKLGLIHRLIKTNVRNKIYRYVAIYILVPQLIKKPGKGYILKQVFLIFKCSLSLYLFSGSTANHFDLCRCDSSSQKNVQQMTFSWPPDQKYKYK